MICVIQYDSSDFDPSWSIFGVTTSLAEAVALIDRDTLDFFGERDKPKRGWLIDVYAPNSTRQIATYLRVQGQWQKHRQYSSVYEPVQLQNEPYWE